LHHNLCILLSSSSCHGDYCELVELCVTVMSRSLHKKT